MLGDVEVRLNTDYFDHKEEFDAMAEKVIYTGPIDAYFDYKLGALEYRSVRFETELLEQPNFQGNAAVNYTDAETPWTRIIEHKWFEFGKDEKGNDLEKTVISREYSSEWKLGDEPYYPVNDEKNGKLYEEYKKLAKKEENIIFGGRLGMYKYFDMDGVLFDTENFLFLNDVRHFLGSKGISVKHLPPKYFIGGRMDQFWENILGDKIANYDTKALEAEYTAYKKYSSTSLR